MTPPVRSRLARAAPALVYLAMVLAMAWRLWWPEAAERRAFNYDALWQYWGDLQFEIDSAKAGELPLWNPWDRAGYPAHADPQLAPLYPVNWVLVAIGAASGPAWWLVALKTLFHLWWAALGAHLFVRRRGAPEAAGYVAGGVLILTYPISKTLWTALNWGAAWAPWMLLAVDAWAEDPSRKRCAKLALVTAMAFLGWAPGASWYALLVVVPYGVWAVAARPRSAWPALARRGALAVGLFLAMTAAQMVATLTLMPQTVRAERDLDFVATSAYAADDLFGMLVPRLPSEMAYFGVAALVLAVWALTVRFEPRRLVLAAVAVFGVLLAFGAFAPFLPALASAPGPFDLFRRAHRYLYVTTLPLGLLAAEGLAELLRGDDDARRRFARWAAAAGAVTALVLVVGAVSQRAQPALRTPYLMGVVSATLGGALLVLLARAPARFRGAAAALVAAAVCTDLYVAMWKHREYNWDRVPKTPRDAEVVALAGVPLEARVWDRELVKYRPGTRRHLRDFGGYQDDPFALRRYARARDLAQRSPRLLALFGVGWLLEDGRKVLARGTADEPVLESMGRGVSRVKGAVPTVMWIDSATVVADEIAAFAVLPGLSPGEAVVEQSGLSADAARRAGTVDAPGAVPVPGRIVAFTPNRLVAEVDAPADGLVLVHEMVHPGWRATVDGVSTPIVVANGLFRAVVVGPGAHRIEMTYHAPLWSGLALLALVAMFGSAVLALRRE